MSVWEQAAVMAQRPQPWTLVACTTAKCSRAERPLGKTEVWAGVRILTHPLAAVSLAGAHWLTGAVAGPLLKMLGLPQRLSLLLLMGLLQDWPWGMTRLHSQLQVNTGCQGKGWPLLYSFIHA